MRSDAMTTTLINGNGILPPPKQIRFVNNQGQPPSKRRRINAACLTCRKRKTRCAGEKPVCSTCSKNGHHCLGYTDLVEKKRDDGGPYGVKVDPEDIGNEEGDEYYDEDEDDVKRHWKARERAKSSTFSSRESSSHRASIGSTNIAPPPPLKRPSNEWEPDTKRAVAQPSSKATFAQDVQTASSYSVSDGQRNSSSRSPLQHQPRQSESQRVPYFRYFGPTAIVPGYKQMVVSVRDRRKSRGGSFSATSPATIFSTGMARSHAPHAETGLESLEDVPAYDPNDSAPVHPLILSLIKTFFLHLGCNYPFLKEAKFLRMVKEKRVEAILVDAVCALGARFSDHPIFATEADRKVARSDFGQVFAQRAKAATVDTFPCPSVGDVQAFLLMAFERFGADQDSALWMYLGLAIRAAVDVGLPRVEGVRYQGEKDPWYTRNWGRKSEGPDAEAKQGTDDHTLSPEEQKEVEQERMDTFWAVFILDRVISSGTGRPVTFRDDDFELSLPDETIDPTTGWPAPFPTFTRIIHLYGRASDVLNKIEKPSDLTPDRLGKLIQMEHDLTQIYQKQDSRLNFTVPNFQEYVKAGQGTTFILLHIWFHALIIILHQPTLLFGSTSEIHQLLPNSRELSMSSAKTIADILAFAELIDPKSYIGNPFTSQPMYIAACAFLMESLANASQPPSRDATPAPDSKQEVFRVNGSSAHGSSAEARSAKHSLLTSAANQNYQRCYKSLQQLHTYWGGVKYILTALDFRSKGFWDCETYTTEEYESTKLIRQQSKLRQFRIENPASPNIPPIALSLTGTTNSPNTNLTLMYQNNVSQSQQLAPPPPPPPVTSVPASAATPPGNMIYDPIRQSLPEPPPLFAAAYPQPSVSALRSSITKQAKHRAAPQSSNSRHSSSAGMHYGYDDVPQETIEQHGSPVTDAKMHMMNGLSRHNGPGQNAAAYSFATSSPQQSSGYESSIMHEASPASSMADSATGQQQQQQQHYHHQQGGGSSHHHGSGSTSSGGGGGGGGYQSDFVHSGLVSGSYSYLGQAMTPMTDMITYDSQDIDIGQLAVPSEMVAAPWLEYLSGDVLGLFEGGAGASAGGGGMNGGGADSYGMNRSGRHA